MLRQKMACTDASPDRPKDRKAYDPPELRQLGTLEDLTRWEASVTVGG
jgi:hypothetical protein